MNEYADLMLETAIYLSAFLTAFDLLCRQVESELVFEVITLEKKE